ncbi:MAG: hypothetical protein NZM29_08405 [Nitrospira sp.]|nr:hypothetical protein [Nitrospira sp.]
MDEMEEGKRKFLELVKSIDEAVQVVIPTAPSNSRFLISLTKGQNRKFVTLSEDDILDLPSDAGIRAKVTRMVKEEIAALEQ